MLTLHQQNKTTEALVESLIVKCRNEDGSKMFQPADRIVLLNECDPAVIIEVAAAINSEQDDYQFDVEQTVKKYLMLFQENHLLFLLIYYMRVDYNF